MLEFIQLLKQRYQILLHHSQNKIDPLVNEQRINQLTLAEAIIRKGKLLDSPRSLPLQIAVIGPTQVGKSSLVNVLLATNAAGVSPLAGYTVHPHGFCHQASLTQCGELQRYFGRFQCLDVALLSEHRYDCYTLSESSARSPLLPPCVIWDTPDFDSIDSAVYREGVLRAVALADVLILVLSKEKYADQTVWDMMTLLADLRQPTLICLNKLSEGSSALLTQSLREKWQHARTDQFPEVVPLYYQKPAGLPNWPIGHEQILTQLQSQLNQRQHAVVQQVFLQHYWQSWLAPVFEEHQAERDWQVLVDELIQHCIESYQRDFLHHPHYYETFQQTVAELLTLLEIPGLAGILTGARKALTWPIRQLMKLGSKQLHIVNSSHEIVLLKQIAEHTMILAADKLIAKAEQSQQEIWWKAISVRLRGERQTILQDFDEAAKTYHLDFQQEVERTAHRLYDKLQEQPRVLNTLRAARVTADAAVIAITLNTGGIGMQDLVIAPAMLTVTSLLTESAIGGYMHKMEAQLKQQQLQQVKQTLFMDSLANKLLNLPRQIAASNPFNISPEQLREIECQLTEKRHGLRLL
ncbi:MAG: 50S ribosome-binding GTPase [Methylovulum sp.]|jgi:hypothetical protein|nr:50S ribosome-binding GTPase [Methylovulum sp.]MCF7999877.1 50S ribosome-binding GTPase [Methylovulum sp.]